MAPLKWKVFTLLCAQPSVPRFGTVKNNIIPVAIWLQVRTDGSKSTCIDVYQKVRIKGSQVLD